MIYLQMEQKFSNLFSSDFSEDAKMYQVTRICEIYDENPKCPKHFITHE